jgi:cholesterol transport system auxiliary component
MEGLLTHCAMTGRTRGTGRAGPAIALFAVVAILGGCSTLVGSGGPVSDIYDLAAPAEFESGRRTNAQLLVPPPSSVDALSGNRIAVRPDPIRIAYFPRAVWSDELPSLLQIKLVRAFETSGRARAVGRPGDSLAIDYQVLVDIRAFEIDVPAGGARVELGVRLLDDRTGRVRATEVFSATVPGGTGAVDGAVEALDRASDQVLRAVVDWTGRTI